CPAACAEKFPSRKPRRYAAVCCARDPAAEARTDSDSATAMDEDREAARGLDPASWTGQDPESARARDSAGHFVARDFAAASDCDSAWLCNGRAAPACDSAVVPVNCPSNTESQCHLAGAGDRESPKVCRSYRHPYMPHPDAHESA